MPVKEMSAPAESGLPLTRNGTDTMTETSSTSGSSWRRRLLFVPLILLTLFTGAVIGMYFQPPTLRIFFGLTGLEPGGGTTNPIATAIRKTIPKKDLNVLEKSSIVALGKLVPMGEVITVAAPYGAGDARVKSLKVNEGQWVESGEILATLDNHDTLQAAITAAQAEVSISQARLNQTRLSLFISRAETEASLKRAEAEAAIAGRELKRAKSLSDRGVATKAALDRAETADRQARQEVQRLTATVARYDKGADLAQANIQLAERQLEAAIVAHKNARTYLERSVIRAPSGGTILNIHVRPGERPGTNGVLELGNNRSMTADIEVYQSQIKDISMGAAVQLRSDAFEEMLHGTVIEIGLDVGRQSIIDNDPAANTDARVISVIVELDNKSTKIASRFINLEVLAWFDSESKS